MVGSKMVPKDPCLLIVTPLCNPFPVSVGWPRTCFYPLGRGKDQMRPTPKKLLPTQPGFKNINTTIGKIQRPGPRNDYPSWLLSLKQVSACYAGYGASYRQGCAANSLTLQGAFLLSLRNKKHMRTVLSSWFRGSTLLKQTWNRQ